MAHSHSGGVHRSHTPLNKEASASHTPTLGGVHHRSHTPLNKEASASHTPTLGGVGIAHSHSGGVHGRHAPRGGEAPGRVLGRARLLRGETRRWAGLQGRGAALGAVLRRTYVRHTKNNPLDKAVNSSSGENWFLGGWGSALRALARLTARAPLSNLPQRGRGRRGRRLPRRPGDRPWATTRVAPYRDDLSAAVSGMCKRFWGERREEGASGGLAGVPSGLSPSGEMRERVAP